MQFLRENILPGEISGKEVLEVGAQNVNGSPREVIGPYGPKAYCGVDFGPGRDVDLVLDVAKLSTHFGPSRFDVVVSTEMLEHAEDWRTAISQMKEVLRPSGLLIVTARGPGCPYHGWPHDYWRFTVADFCFIFSDMQIEICRNDSVPGVLLKARKTPETGKVDLGRLSIEPILKPEKKVKLSVIVPTCGRASLYTTLHSIWMNGIRSDDEVIVIGDGRQPEAARIVGAFKDRLTVRYEETAPSGCVGAAQRNHGMAIATGSHFMFMDDDDVYVNGGLNKGRNAAFYNPDRPVIFRLRSAAKRHGFDSIWNGQSLEMGNVGTQMFLVPNIKERLGQWLHQPGSDNAFIRQTVDKYPNRESEIVWANEVIAELR